MNAPVSTTNIAIKTAVSDELIVNRDGSTSVQATSDLALQLASSWPLQISGNAGKLFTTFATLAATAYGDFTPWVFADPDINKNGLYRWNGASWVWSLPLPFSFLIASNFGAGTAAAIKATTLSPVSTAALILLPIADDYAGDAATVSFNGGAVLAIKSSIGEDVTRLAAGSFVYGVISGNTFRLANDEAIASLIYEARDLAENASARAVADADRAHDEADRSEVARDIAAGYASDAVSQGSVPIYGTVLGVTALNIPAGINAFRLNGYAAAGDLGGWFMAVGIPNTGTLMPWQVQTNDGTRRWELRADEASALSFGVTGDGSADDREAIYNALMWWRATGYTLRFPAGSYRMASGILLDMSGVAQAGKIIFEGAIKPDPGIGAAITFRNVRGGLFVLAVDGGGQTADYRIADPAGGDEAFRFVNCLGGVIDWVRGQNYKGRVLRITSDTNNLGPDGFRTQGMLIRNCYFATAAKSTDPEATRLDQGVGQGFFIDTRAGAFGTIERVWWFWELYGSVADRTTDMTINDGESLYRGISGLQLRGLISFSAGSLKLGSEMTGFSEPLLTISDSADGVTNTQNSRIKDLLLIGGAIGLSAKNVGLSAGQSLDIGQVNSRLNTDKGILLDNCRKMTIGNLTSFGDKVGLHIAGASDDIDIKASIRSSKAQAIIIDAPVTGNIKIAGRAFDGNEDNVADVSLIDVNTVTPVFFNDFIASSAKVDYLYDIVSGNSTSIEGGRVVISGATARNRNQPNRAINVRGWATANAGTVTLPASATSVVVPHGLVKAPDTVVLTPRGPLGSPPYVSAASRTATEFSIGVATAVGSAQPIDWVARCDYGRI